MKAPVSRWTLSFSADEEGKLHTILHGIPHGFIVYVSHDKYEGDAEWMRADPNDIVVRRYSTEMGLSAETLVLDYEGLSWVHLY